MAEGSARYAHEGDTWFLRLDGELRHTLGPALNALFDRAFADPEYRQCVIDLSDASSIDSTCLGILARTVTHAQGRAGPRPTLICGNEDITETLQAVCFDRLFNLVDAGPGGLPGLEALPTAPGDRDAVLAVVLAAHKRLCALDVHNAEVFKDVVAALEARAGQHRAGDS